MPDITFDPIDVCLLSTNAEVLLEPLAQQEPMGPEVACAVDALCRQLDGGASVPQDLRQSVRGRLLQLKRESVRQALKRLCQRWFPSESAAWGKIDRAYVLRSELLHEGRPNDLDFLLHEETQGIAKYLRRIYQHEYGYPFRAGPGE